MALTNLRARIARVVKSNHVEEKRAQSMLQLLSLVCAVCTWKPGRLEQVVDIPIPQTDEKTTEMNQLVPQERIQQHTATFSCDPCRTCRELQSIRRHLVVHCRVL